MISDEEKQILSSLRRNSRTSLKKLAFLLNLPSSSVHAKVKQFEGSIILKHTSLLDFQKLGLYHVFFALKTSKESRNSLADFLKKSSYTNTIYQVNDQFDFLVEAVFEHNKSSKDFIDELKGSFPIDGIYVHNVISNLKKEEFGAAKPL